MNQTVHIHELHINQTAGVRAMDINEAVPSHHAPQEHINQASSGLNGRLERTGKTLKLPGDVPQQMRLYEGYMMKYNS